MKFAIKLQHDNGDARWDVFDDPRVNNNLDAFAFGKVMAETWNNDLKPGETTMRILNAQVLGPGLKKRTLAPYTPNQLDLFKRHVRSLQ
jgi:hypothetical protein